MRRRVWRRLRPTEETWISQKTLKNAVDAGDRARRVAAAAATDKGVIFEGGAGALKPDSVIWIASMTKAITGAAAMQLVERGKLSLDAPAADVVPELGTKEVLDGLRRGRQGDHAQAQRGRSPCVIC